LIGTLNFTIITDVDKAFEVFNSLIYNLINHTNSKPILNPGLLRVLLNPFLNAISFSENIPKPKILYEITFPQSIQVLQKPDSISYTYIVVKLTTTLAIFLYMLLICKKSGMVSNQRNYRVKLKIHFFNICASQ